MNRALPLTCLLALAGCAAPEGFVEPDFEGPGLAGKADGFSSIETFDIAFGSEATGAFTEDFQFFAYEFAAREDAELRAEITQRGSARGLDTTMFLYRLSDESEPSRIAADDDSGWGALSRIDDFRLFSEGRYAIVVGTRAAAGRGNFRVTLECLSGECEPLVPAEPICASRMVQSAEECLEEIGHENGYELPLDEAAALCRQDLDLTYEHHCDGADAPEWCHRGMAAVVRACDDLLEDLYPSEDALAARVTDITPDAFGTIVADAHASEGCGVSEESGCGVALAAFRYEGAQPRLEEVFALMRSRSEIGPGVHVGQQSREDAVDGLAMTFGVDAALTAAIEELGGDARESVEGSTFQDAISWNFGDCQVDGAVAIYPSSQLIVVFDTLFCAG